MLSPLEFAQYVKIQEPGELALEYKLWPHLIKYFEVLQKHKRIIVLKAKQVGISWATALDTLHLLYTKPGANVLFLSRGDREARELLSKVPTIFNNLPQLLRITDPKDPLICLPNSSEGFGFKQLGSRVRSFPSTLYAGIGETANRAVHDEYSFHEYARINFGHTSATVADGTDRQMVITSTANKEDPDSHFNELFRGAIDGRNGFHPLFFGWNVRPDRDQDWYEERKLEYADQPWLLEQNCPNSWEEALSPQSAMSCFDKDKLKSLWENAIEPECEQGFIYILHPPRVGVAYCAGVDVGEGVGLDYSCLTIIGKQGLESEVAAVIYTNTLATDLFAYECDKLCRTYFNCILAVENNSLGIAVTNKLLELNYPNLYYSDSKRTKAGWTTGEKNKHTALAELVPNIKNSSLITRFKPQIKEMMEFQWVNGKPTATGKTHGDTVISLMIANQMLKKIGVEREMHAYIRGKKYGRNYPG